MPFCKQTKNLVQSKKNWLSAYRWVFFIQNLSNGISLLNLYLQKNDIHNNLFDNSKTIDLAAVTLRWDQYTFYATI